ncbi:MAG: phosphosulfolactate synthase [Paracoccaceae bacterium]
MSRFAFDFLPVHPGRTRAKPRRAGLTMTIDGGVPIGRAADMLEMAGAHVDIAKIKTGGSRLYPRDYLKRKIALYREHGLDVFPGGQFLEYVIHANDENALRLYWDEAVAMGFSAIEVSDNVVALNDNQRRSLIKDAIATGLKVFGEVGSKETETDPETLFRQAEVSLDAGASLLLIEAAELIGERGVNEALLRRLIDNLDMSKVLIELPGPWISGVSHHMIDDMAKLLVRELGPDVNLGNVAFDQIFDLETTRSGLGVAGPPGAGSQAMKT